MHLTINLLTFKKHVMNSKINLIIVLSFCTFSLFAQPDIYSQLCALNKQWQSIVPTGELLETRQFSSEQEIITYHLQQVEKHLTQKNTAHLTKEVQQCRQEGIEVLHAYWKRGLYPKNNHFNYQIPFFIDEANTACAVGYIMQGTGNEALAQYIAETQNNAYVKQMVGDNIFEWANNYGFTVDELAWIQPAYGPCWNGHPFQQNVVQPTCGNNDGSFEVFITEGTTYEWAHGASGLQLNNLSAGAYTLTGTYNDECPFELNVILKDENSADLSVNTLNHQTCQGIEDGMLEVAVSNANGSYAIEWSNGANGTIASNLTQGYHFVTVTDAANCKAIEQTYISIINAMYSNQLVSGSICNGNTGEVDLNLSGGAGNQVFTCQWMDGNTAENRTNMNAGDYSVIMSDDAGCFMEKNITVYDDCEGKITCADDFADVNNQYGGYMFLIDNDVDPSDAKITQAIITQPTYGFIYETSFDFYYSNTLDEYTAFAYSPSDNTYTGPDSFTYTVCTDYGFCDSATVYLNVVAQPVVQVLNTVSEDLVICPDESIQLIAQGAQTYTWSPSTGLDQSTGSYVLASPTQTTTYSVIGTTADGQTDSYDITIEVAPDISPTINGLPTVSNINDSAINLSASPAGGVFSGNGIFFNAFNPILTLPGEQEITYTYTDEGSGCIYQTSQNIIIFLVSFNFVNYNLGTVSPKIGELAIETHTEQLGDYDLLLTDVQGRIMHQEKLAVNQTKQIHQLKNIEVPFGMYVATLKNQQQHFSKQLILGR